MLKETSLGLFKRNREFTKVVEEPVESKSSKKGGVKGVVDGSFLANDSVVKQLPYVLFMAFLAVVYIANRYHAEKIVGESMRLERELKELRSEKIAIQAELMFISKQSEVAVLVKEKGLGLEESFEPPKKIIVKL